MSDASVSERRIRPIQDAVASSNWKQALQLCDKWSKKGEASDLFLTLKAFVLVNQHDGPQQQRGTAETTGLCTRNPAITDVAALDQLQATLKHLSLEIEDGAKIWDRAAAAKPKDKDLLMTWLKRSVSGSDWLSAQKATMALRKAFPQERKYDFWNIVMCQLIHIDYSVPEKDRKLFGMLAFRLISKAADAVPKDKKEILSSGKAVQTPEELYLLMRIYLSQDRAEDAVKLLRSEIFGLESRFAEQDSQLIMSILLEALEASRQWKDAFDFCNQLVTEKRFESFDPANDGRIWKLLLRAIKESEKTISSERLKELLAHRLEETPGIRSARQTKLLLASDEAEVTGSQSDLLGACQAYYRDFSNKGHCFEDLKRPLAQLKESSLDDFMKIDESKLGELDLKTDSDVSRLLLNLKLRYRFRKSSLETPATSQAFASDALKLYKVSQDQKNPLPEACLLAAVAIFENAFSKTESQNTHSACLMRAMVILWGCCERFEEYYPALLLLIRLQLSLGLTSAAMTSFKNLSVKNIQWETMGHLILTRMSTLHPLQYGKITPSEDTGFNPLEAIDLTLDVAENAGKSLARGIAEGLNCGSYVNVMESVQMKSEIERSLNRQIASVEERRIQRLRGIFDDTSLPRRQPSLADKRDLGSYIDFVQPNSTAARPSFCGPIPKKVWLCVMSLQDETSRLLASALQAPSGSTSLPLGDLRHILNLTCEVDVMEGEELTPTEHHNHECHRLVAEAVIKIQEAVPGEQAKLDELVDKMLLWLEGKCIGINQRPGPATHGFGGDFLIGDIRTPSWEYLHSRFSKTETLQLLSLFAAVAVKRSKGAKTKPPAVSKERITGLQKLVAEAHTSIHDDAKQLKAGLNAPGVLGRLVDVTLGKIGEEEDLEIDAVGSEIEKLCDAAALETLCGAVRDSWENSLDVLLAVKVKAFK